MTSNPFKLLKVASNVFPWHKVLSQYRNLMWSLKLPQKCLKTSYMVVPHPTNTKSHFAPWGALRGSYGWGGVKKGFSAKMLQIVWNAFLTIFCTFDPTLTPLHRRHGPHFLFRVADPGPIRCKRIHVSISYRSLKIALHTDRQTAPLYLVQK